MKIDKKLIKELKDYLDEFNLSEIEYQDGTKKVKVAKKITETKTGLKRLYSDPKNTIDLPKVQKWAAVQIVKAFLGIPIVPGK